MQPHTKSILNNKNDAKYSATVANMQVKTAFHGQHFFFQNKRIYTSNIQCKNGLYRVMIFIKISNIMRIKLN